MNRKEEIAKKESEINGKIIKLEKLKKDYWKIILIVVATDLVLPYFPLRNGRLVDKYGYQGTVLFGAIVYIIIIPIIYFYAINKSEKEIAGLAHQLDSLKRSDEFET